MIHLKRIIHSPLIFVFVILAMMSTTTVRAAERSSHCKLEIVDINTGKRTLIREFNEVIEAPNWTKDGRYLIYNSKGLLYRIRPIPNAKPKRIDTHFVNHCNNDHVLSPNGKDIALSHLTQEDMKSRIYITSLKGRVPTLITPLAPSYLHGWSPDGKVLCYCAQRHEDFDIYTISAQGGIEKRLTTTKGLDDGPEYAPDGNFIWFNSVRTGSMQIWRMNSDGSNPKQMTFLPNRYAWFPHIAPNNKYMVYISYDKAEVKANQHLADKNVKLHITKVENDQPTESLFVIDFFGGQGSINVNSWSPDSNSFAFVSYSKP